MTEELVHVRCYCGKVLANKWNTYKRLLEEGKSIKESLDELKLFNECCRMRMMSPSKFLSNFNQEYRQIEEKKTINRSITKSTQITSPLSVMSGKIVIPDEEEKSLVTARIPAPSFLSLPGPPLGGLGGLGEFSNIQLDPIKEVDIKPVEKTNEIVVSRKYIAR